ncbi:2-phospho-L-lactate transferase [Bradyrhizobium canariense]|uniref:LPPG:FO 2-phospho-L-lactate transferase n=1 Tax=Bradyrhizobium canariense TaxID=255045 RepID=A0A1H1YQS6_9BRAD|nr:2-phospho-L-lactate transferase [Bradyrhizobium canariense]SDT23757.1 LPPG:FO 2-phospho-L-lactate transferase [Bradyrhizobium canariense]
MNGTSGSQRKSIVALCGGVGGAKLALGLDRVAAENSDISIVANVGDDFRWLGLYISPDIDTILYTLSGNADEKKGWGRKDETWSFMEALQEIRSDAWFNLGDKDLALHVERSSRMAAGASLSETTNDLRAAFKVRSRIIPVSDDSIRTYLRSKNTWLPFQEYFVHQKCEPSVSEIAYRGAELARLHDDVRHLLIDETPDAVVICPSNPMLSIEPMLAIPELRQALRETKAPVVGVSPIISREAVKGPTAKLFTEFGIEPSAQACAYRYRDFIDAFVIDLNDEVELPGVEIRKERILMTTNEDKQRVATCVLDFAASMAKRKT